MPVKHLGTYVQEIFGNSDVELLRDIGAGDIYSHHQDVGEG